MKYYVGGTVVTTPLSSGFDDDHDDDLDPPYIITHAK